MSKASIKPARSVWRLFLAAILVWLAASAGPALAVDQPYPHLDPKTGYRMGHYRAPTPPSIEGATRIGRETLRGKIASNEVLLVDVIAHVGGGYDPITGEWFVQEERRNIPGSIWLADVGAGHLTPAMARYYRDNLEKLTGGDKSRPIVIYCQADCWMGWNAVKRAIDWGYSQIYWYPEGSDDWSEAGLPLTPAKPVPVNLDE